jgi:hypothetical protein
VESRDDGYFLGGAAKAESGKNIKKSTRWDLLFDGPLVHICVG